MTTTSPITEDMSEPAIPHPDEPSQHHLAGRLVVLEHKVQRAVALRIADEPTPHADPFQSLHIPGEQLRQLLQGNEAPLQPHPLEQDLQARLEAYADQAEARGHVLPLRRVASIFGLDEVDTELLLIALAPDLDSRFERFYGYLANERSTRHATVGLALHLCGISPISGHGQARLSAGPLAVHGLMTVRDPEDPYLTRRLHVPDRIASFLLQQSNFPQTLTSVASPPAPPPPLPPSALGTVDSLALLLRHYPLAYLQGAPGSAATAIADNALHRLGHSAVRVTLPPDSMDVRELLTAVVLEAQLNHWGLLIPFDQHMPPPKELRALLDQLTNDSAPVVCTGAEPWNSQWCSTTPGVIRCPPLTTADRAELWRSELAVLSRTPDHDRMAMDMAPYRLEPEQILATVQAAHRQSEADQQDLDISALRTAAKFQHAGRLEHLARRIEPSAGWDDLIVTEFAWEYLQDIVRRARHREQVHLQWNIRAGGGRGTGVTALFSGESGTGKTLAAEVIASELGLDLYVINLASVVDKYIGETEKNLERIFSEAEGLNGVLLFDEADAVFGKRSDVKDAHDRYANTQTAYLLQRLEAFDGLVIMTTNLYSNMDSAFARRLDVIVQFPLPDAEQRRALWGRCLRPIPSTSEIDLDRLAKTFELSGGGIRCCTVTAAYRAADAGRPMTTGDLLEAVRAYHHKMGHLVNEEEFTELLRGDP